MSNEILVIQLDRIGDLIQTMPFVESLHQAFPEASVDLMVTRGNAVAVQGNPWLRRVISISEVELSQFNSGLATKSPDGGMSELLLSWSNQFDHCPYDQVYNCCSQRFGAWLMQQMPSASRRGGFFTPQGEWLYSGDWGPYLLSMLDYRAWNRFNLVDLFRAAGPRSVFPHPGSRSYLAKDSSWVSGLGPGVHVGLNPGASEAHRRYPVHRFVELVQRCREAGWIPVLVGAPSDRELCAEIVLQSEGEIADYSGKTSIPQMAQLLSELDVLVSNDTGAVHMAAAVGTPVVGLFGVSAFLHETGPWGEGHVILQAPLGESPALLETISAQAVMAAVEYQLGQAQESHLKEAVRDCPGVEAWRSTFLGPEDGPLGGVVYQPLVTGLTDFQRVWALHLRRVFSLHLGTEVSRHLPVYRELGEWHTEWDSVFETLRPLVQSASSLAQQAKRLSTMAESDPDSSVLQGLISPFQSRFQEFLQSVEQQSPLWPVMAFLQWKSKMVSISQGWSGVLNHQYRTLELGRNLLLEAGCGRIGI